MEGRQRGFDTGLIKGIVDAVSIPVVAGSGAGSLKDIRDMVRTAKPDAVAVASMLHYGTTTIEEIKKYLHKSGIEVTL